MNSKEWDRKGFSKYRNPSGEVIRTKSYHRTLIAWDNCPSRTIVAQRKALANLLGVPWYDLLADLQISIRIERYPRHKRFLKFIPRRKS